MSDRLEKVFATMKDSGGNQINGRERVKSVHFKKDMLSQNNNFRGERN